MVTAEKKKEKKSFCHSTYCSYQFWFIWLIKKTGPRWQSLLSRWMTRLAQDGSSFCSRLSRWRRWEHIAHLFFFFLRPGLHQMNKRVYTMSCFNTHAVNVRLCSGTNEQHTKFECVCVRESKSEWVCKYSLHGRAIHSVVTVILRDCIDWSWWRMRYQAEGHLSLSVVSLSLCLTHTHTHSGTRLERPHEWIEMESNHTVKWLHNNFSFAVFALWVVLFRALLKSTVF